MLFSDPIGAMTLAETEHQPRYRAAVLFTAHPGLRFGKVAALRRERDLRRSRLQPLPHPQLLDDGTIASYCPAHGTKPTNTYMARPLQDVPGRALRYMRARLPTDSR
jgi:hypothetical protein